MQVTERSLLAEDSQLLPRHEVPGSKELADESTHAGTNAHDPGKQIASPDCEQANEDERSKDEELPPHQRLPVQAVGRQEIVC